MVVPTADRRAIKAADHYRHHKTPRVRRAPQSSRGFCRLGTQKRANEIGWSVRRSSEVSQEEVSHRLGFLALAVSQTVIPVQRKISLASGGMYPLPTMGRSAVVISAKPPARRR
jgi:hypothetical protein